jgi:uncharacterized protein (UPF0335 family)
VEVGVSYSLEEGEQSIVKDSIPAKIRIERKKTLGRESLLNDMVDDEGILKQKDVIEAYAIPYLTNKKIILWLLLVSKRLGPFGRWWELPLEYIKGVNFKKSDNLGELQIKYKVPEIEKGLIRKTFHLKRGIEEFYILLTTRSMATWKTNLTKLILDTKQEKLKPKIKKLEDEKSEITNKLSEVEKSFLKAKITESSYKQMKAEQKSKLDKIESEIKNLQREISEIEEFSF